MLGSFIVGQYRIELDPLSSTKIQRELVNFDDRVTNTVRRSRAGNS